MGGRYNSQKDYLYSKENLGRLSNYNINRKFSDEHKRKISEAKKGHITSQETRDKISKANIKENPKMSALHMWVRKYKPISHICKECNKYSKRIEVANISGKYLRDINDYQWLCPKCHRHIDGNIKYLKSYKGVEL